MLFELTKQVITVQSPMSPEEMSNEAHALADAIQSQAEINSDIARAADSLAALKSSSKDELKELEVKIRRHSSRIQTGKSYAQVEATKVALPDLGISLFRLPDGTLARLIEALPSNYQFTIQDRESDEDPFNIDIDDLAVITSVVIDDGPLSANVKKGLITLLNMYIDYSEAAPELRIPEALEILAPAPENEPASQEQSN